MENTTLIIVGSLVIGSIVGYFTRLSIVKYRAKGLESRLEKMTEKAKTDVKEKIFDAKKQALEILEEAKKQEQERQSRLSKIEELLLKREESLEKRIKDIENKEISSEEKKKKLEALKEELESVKEQKIKELEKISSLSTKEAKDELFRNVEKNSEEELLKKIHTLETQNQDALNKRAQDIIATALQRYSSSVVSEVTTTYVNLPSEELKGKIIGKEGRNIKTLERLTGVDVVVDETPDTVMISSFNPIRRQIARVALEELIKDGRIQPARIEEAVIDAKEKINEKVKEAGEAAVYDVGVTGLDPRLIQLLGRLRYRTSFGQNVLLHSIEAAHIAGMIASELGANVQTAKKGALLHDVGKAIDHEVQGTHVEIGIRILEKFSVGTDVVLAMRPHHGDYPYETPESIIVQVAESISAARPGARKDTVEAYIKRLEDIERIVSSFDGVEKSYAIQAGREVRIFVTPDKVSDLEMRNLAKKIAESIEEELSYPGEIKVNVIRETRAAEYAK